MTTGPRNTCKSRFTSQDLTPILGGGSTGRPRSRLRAPGIRVSQGLHLRSHTYTGGRVDRPSSVTTTGPRNTCKSRFTSQDLTPIPGGGSTGRPRSRLRAPGIRVSQGLHLRSHTYTGGRVDRPSSVMTTGPRNTCMSRFTSQVSHLYWGEG